MLPFMSFCDKFFNISLWFTRLGWKGFSVLFASVGICFCDNSIVLEVFRPSLCARVCVCRCVYVCVYVCVGGSLMFASVQFVHTVFKKNTCIINMEFQHILCGIHRWWIFSSKIIFGKGYIFLFCNFIHNFNFRKGKKSGVKWWPNSKLDVL